jgi:hypothetical protein
MTTLNSYATLAEYKSFVTARGQTSTTDSTDDSVIEMLLKAASRYIDNQTARRFYPFVQTRYYDVPDAESIDPRMLRLDGDLLEVISIVNGDGVTIASTEYTLRPRNETPYIYVRLIDNSTYYWTGDGAGDTHDVIAITGIWGFHNEYDLAWLVGSTLAEDLDTSETAVDVTSGTLFAVGDLIRFGNELGYVSAKATNTLTSTRGENGSTAAAHDTAGNVYIWQFMSELKTAVLETAMQAYKRRFGQSGNNIQTVTAAGVVLTPRDIPAMTIEFIKNFRRYV